jgi:hypothetical protein
MKTIFALFLSMVLTACATTSKNDALYNDLGGQQGIEKIADYFIEEFSYDRNVIKHFEKTATVQPEWRPLPIYRRQHARCTQEDEYQRSRIQRHGRCLVCRHETRRCQHNRTKPAGGITGANAGRYHLPLNTCPAAAGQLQRSQVYLFSLQHPLCTEFNA